MTFWVFIDRVTERFGPAGTVLVFIFVCVKIFASTDTQDRVMQEIFFRSETHTPYVQVFLAVLLLMVALDSRLLWRYLSGDSKETQRLREEVGKLQQQLLGATAPPGKVVDE